MGAQRLWDPSIPSPADPPEGWGISGGGTAGLFVSAASREKLQPDAR